MRTCLVLGSAACLWADIEAALDVGEYDAVIAAKQAGIVWPGELHSWVSLHPDWMEDYIVQRQCKRYPDAREVVGHTMLRGVIDRVVEPKWPEQQQRSGASGMFAVKVAIEDGFERIVLCGVPMSPEISRIDGRKGWPSARRYQTAVLLALPRIKDKVRSVSGWTQEVLGAPTPSWLNG